MAQMRDIPTSILAKEGTEVKKGVLSILEKKGIKMLKSSDYQLYHLHWRLVSYDDQTYLLGYSRTLGRASVTKKLLVKGCSTEMNLPAKVVVSSEDSETFLCIQCGEKITFLKAESKQQRDTWVDAIRSVIKEPIYYPSAVSTPEWQMTYRVLAEQNRRSQEMASPMALQSQESAFHSLNSADRMQSSSQPKLNNPGIYIKKHNGNEGFEHGSEPPLENLSSSESDEPLYEDVPDENFYMTPSPPDSDDQSSVNNLGLESEGNTNSPFNYSDDSAAPELPTRDNQNKTRAPQQPEASTDQMDSIQREKTVCLETPFQSDHQPTERDKSDDDNEKEMHGKMNSEAPNRESIHAYIQRFRSELFQEDGFIVEVDKIDLSPESITLMCVADCICIAALPNAKLHSLLHVDDVIVKVNRQMLPSIDFCYTLFRTTDEKQVQLHVKRVMHGIMCHVNLSANGDVDSLGLEFGNQIQGNEVTAMHSEGLVAKSGSPSRPRALGVINGGMLVNWGLVEINRSPVSFDSSPADVRDQIQRAGCELALVFIPMDIINVFMEGLCEESTDHASEGEGTC